MRWSGGGSQNEELFHVEFGYGWCLCIGRHLIKRGMYTWGCRLDFNQAFSFSTNIYCFLIDQRFKTCLVGVQIPMRWSGGGSQTKELFHVDFGYIWCHCIGHHLIKRLCTPYLLITNSGVFLYISLFYFSMKQKYILELIFDKKFVLAFDIGNI